MLVLALAFINFILWGGLFRLLAGFLSSKYNPHKFTIVDEWNFATFRVLSFKHLWILYVLEPYIIYILFQFYYIGIATTAMPTIVIPHVCEISSVIERSETLVDIGTFPTTKACEDIPTVVDKSKKLINSEVQHTTVQPVTKQPKTYYVYISTFVGDSTWDWSKFDPRPQDGSSGSLPSVEKPSASSSPTQPHKAEKDFYDDPITVNDKEAFSPEVPPIYQNRVYTTCLLYTSDAADE